LKIGTKLQLEPLRMWIFVHRRFKNIADGFLYDAECILYRIGALTASACSGGYEL
jgi:hypothetical protein